MKNMKKIIAFSFAVILLCLSFTACTKPAKDDSSMPEDTSGIAVNGVYDETLDATVTLGMTKADVDELLGEPLEAGKGTATLQNFLYNNGLSVDFKDEVVYNMLVTEEAVQCKISYDVTVGAELATLPEAFSQDLGANLGRVAYYDADNKPVTALLDAAFQVMLRTDPETEKVTSIYIMSIATNNAEDTEEPAEVEA